jgi:hypothetical protein
MIDTVFKYRGILALFLVIGRMVVIYTLPENRNFDLTTSTSILSVRIHKRWSSRPYSAAPACDSNDVKNSKNITGAVASLQGYCPNHLDINA